MLRIGKRMTIRTDKNSTVRFRRRAFYVNYSFNTLFYIEIEPLFQMNGTKLKETLKLMHYTKITLKIRFMWLLLLS